MEKILYFLFGIAVGGAVVWWKMGIDKVSRKTEIGEKYPKDGWQRKIMELVDEKEKITNNDVEELLGVSDATATRHLDALEKSGFLRQVGRTGRHVFYERK
mgnify:CR=1 FL=1